MERAERDVDNDAAGAVADGNSNSVDGDASNISEKVRGFASFLDDLEWMAAAGWAPGANEDQVMTGVEQLATAVAASDHDAEWEEIWDQGRQRNYYHHVPSGRVQWKAPSEWHAKAISGAAGATVPLNDTQLAKTLT